MKHVLSRHDTPEKLSARYFLPVCMLYRANTGKVWRPGQILWIPPVDWCASRKCGACRQTKESIFHYREYEVGHGEKIYEIAQKFKTSMRAILSENRLQRPEEIKEGMVLKIPCLNDGFMIYSYRMADTPEEVAQKFSMTKEELISLNEAQGGIYPGMQLVVRKRGSS